MRKQNNSIPPALEPDSQLNNSVTRSRKCKCSNAQTHGPYARLAFIPGEDPREFDQILDELFAYWKPAGPDLRDALCELAEMKFRKRRLNRYVQTQLYQCTFNPHHPAFYEMWGFCMFIQHLNAEPETCFDEHAEKYLRPVKIDYLRQKFPRTNYPSTAEWAKAITSEILSAPVKPRIEAPELGYSVDDVEQAAREWKTDQQVAYAREFLEFELKETERLNGLIIKQTRYCAELKLWEESRDKK